MTKKHILICGLLPRQARRVEAMRFDNLELHFVPKDAAPCVWSTASEQCEAVLIMTKFISHKHVAHLKLRERPTRIIYCNGGLASLERLLRQE